MNNPIAVCPTGDQGRCADAKSGPDIRVAADILSDAQIDTRALIHYPDELFTVLSYFLIPVNAHRRSVLRFIALSYGPLNVGAANLGIGSSGPALLLRAVQYIETRLGMLSALLTSVVVASDIKALGGWAGTHENA